MGRTHDKLLLAAARRGNVGRIQRLVAEGADVNTRGKYGYTPLFHASSGGHADAVRLLLDAGAIPSLTTDDGGTAHIGQRARGMVMSSGSCSIEESTWMPCEIQAGHH
jgi:uncharacterized protein